MDKGTTWLDDLAFCAGQRNLATPVKPDKDAGQDFDIDQSVGVKPKILAFSSIAWSRPGWS
jgi:hypothetical protein